MEQGELPGIFVYDGKGGTGHAAPAAERLRQSADEGCFPGSEISGQGDHRARTAALSQVKAGPAGIRLAAGVYGHNIPLCVFFQYSTMRAKWKGMTGAEANFLFTIPFADDIMAAL